MSSTVVSENRDRCTTLSNKADARFDIVLICLLINGFAKKMVNTLCDFQLLETAQCGFSP